MNKIEVSATVTFSSDADEFDEPRRRWENPVRFLPDSHPTSYFGPARRLPGKALVFVSSC